MASRPDVRIFTIQEANEAVSELRQTLPAMRRILRDIERIEDRLEVLDLICDRAVSSDNPDLREFLSAKVRYHRRITEFEGMLGSLDSQGYLLRDLDKGIVHFPARRGPETVLLCWNEGERAVAHWHRLDGDAAPDENGRRGVAPGDRFQG